MKAYFSTFFRKIFTRKEKPASTDPSLTTRTKSPSINSNTSSDTGSDASSDKYSENQIDQQAPSQLVNTLVQKLAARPKIFTPAAAAYNAKKEKKYFSVAKEASKMALKTGKDFTSIYSTTSKLSKKLGKGNFITGILKNGLLFELANIDSFQAQTICNKIITSPGFTAQKEKVGILKQFSNEELTTFVSSSIAFISTIKGRMNSLENIGNNLAEIVSINKDMKEITDSKHYKAAKTTPQESAITLYKLEKDRSKSVFSLIGNSLRAISSSTSVEAFLQITEKLVENLDSKALNPAKSEAIERIKLCEDKIKELNKITKDDPTYVETQAIKHLYIRFREETIKKNDINIIDKLQFLVQKKLKIPAGDLKELFQSNKQPLSLLANEMINYPDEKNILINAVVDYKNSSPTEETKKLISVIDAGINLAKHDDFIKSVSDAGIIAQFTKSVLELPQMNEKTTKLKKLFKGNIEGLYEVINHNSADVMKGLTSLGNFSDYKGSKQLIELATKAQKESLPLKEILKQTIDIYTQYPESMPKITEQLILNKKLIAEKIDYALDRLDNNAAKGVVGWLKFANFKGEFFADLLCKVNNPQDLKAISECLEKPKLEDTLNILIKHGSTPVALAARTLSTASKIYKSVSSSIETLKSYALPITQSNTTPTKVSSPQEQRNR